MSSLQPRYKTLSPLVPDLKPEDMLHVTRGIYCPVSVLYGSPHIHTHNGVYVARSLSLQSKGECGIVYVSCPYCVLDKSLMPNKKKGEGLASIVAGSENMAYPWVAYTREGFPGIMKAAAEQDKASPVNVTKANGKGK
jgi:hypothetical protein